MRDVHKKAPGPVEVVKVTCMLPKKNSNTGEPCNSKLPLADMYRHLGDVHGKPKPSKTHYLKCFKSLDGGKTYSEPVYLTADEIDPSETESCSNAGSANANKESAKRKLPADDNEATKAKVKKGLVTTS